MGLVRPNIWHYTKLLGIAICQSLSEGFSLGFNPVSLSPLRDLEDGPL